MNQHGRDHSPRLSLTVTIDTPLTEPVCGMRITNRATRYPLHLPDASATPPNGAGKLPASADCRLRPPS